jgi:hypothetical protein
MMGRMMAVMATRTTTTPPTTAAATIVSVPILEEGLVGVDEGENAVVDVGGVGSGSVEEALNCQVN